MFCHKCGTEAQNVADVCSKCGTRLYPDFIVDERPADNRQFDNRQQSAPQKPKGGSSSSVVLILIIVAALGVVMFLGIIAAIAIPNFLMYQAKSKQTEAKVNLKGIYVAEEAYFSENNCYTDDFASLGWAPTTRNKDGVVRYSYYISPQNGGLPDSSNALPADATPFADDKSFSAVAVGNIDSDPTMDVWSVSQNNDLMNVMDDVSFHND